MKLSTLAFLTIGTISAANAVPVYVNFTDVVDPTPDVLLTTSKLGINTYTFSHNIIDNGYNPDLYDVVGASIGLVLDDDQVKDSEENVRIKLDNVKVASNLEVNYGVYTFNVSTKYLEKDGILTVELFAKKGDFYFRSSTLDVTAVTVPEPGTMALVGFGLLAAGLAARRRKI